MTTTTTLESLTAATFDEAIAASPVPVLVDVWAEWCGPCHALEPVLASIAAEQSDRLRVVKLDSDEHPEISLRFGIMSLPTMLVFRDGVLVDRLVGARGKARLLQDLAGALG
jgi:thioredoxin 1